eukprot:315287-Alexandrium_andersonii.AAC.1
MEERPESAGQGQYEVDRARAETTLRVGHSERAGQAVEWEELYERGRGQPAHAGAGRRCPSEDPSWGHPGDGGRR